MIYIGNLGEVSIDCITDIMSIEYMQSHDNDCCGKDSMQ